MLPRGRTVNRRRRKHEARLKERKGQGWFDLGDTSAASPSLQVICPRHGKVEKGGRGIQHVEPGPLTSQARNPSKPCRPSRVGGLHLPR